MKSVMMLQTVVMSCRIPYCIQWPSIESSQKDSIGIHWQIAPMALISDHATVKTPSAQRQ